MKKIKKWLDAGANEWLCTLEWQEAKKGEKNMYRELTLKKVEHGYILSWEEYIEVCEGFKNVVKRLEAIFGEEKKKESKRKRR